MYRLCLESNSLPAGKVWVRCSHWNQSRKCMTTGTKMGTQHISGSTCVNSPTSTLANNFAASLFLKSSVAHLPNRKKPEKRLQSAMHLRSTHCGLNSVLDGTPSPVMNLGTKAAKIRRQSLSMATVSTVQI